MIMIDFGLSGKTALVTGGTAGIGKAVAAQFVAAGARVVIVGRRSDGEQTAAAISAEFLRADVTQIEQVATMFDSAEAMLGPLDIVVLNAGIDPGQATLAELEPKAVESNLDVNYRHVLWGLKHAPGHMNDGGSITVTASTVAITSVPTIGHYAAIKAAAVSLAKTAALELGERGIRVNAVMPGTTLSEMTPPDHWEVEVMKTMLPLGRHAIAEEDLVGLYQFLASDASRYITGQAIACDAGMTAGLSYGLLRGVGAPI
jgi:NAD(P)-dependent dehydrogenase (short-subunit alcohol dehydrogenase family)